MEIEPSPFVTTIGEIGLLILSRVNPQLICCAGDCIASRLATNAVQKIAGLGSLSCRFVFIVIQSENPWSLCPSERLRVAFARSGRRVKYDQTGHQFLVLISG